MKNLEFFLFLNLRLWGSWLCLTPYNSFLWNFLKAWISFFPTHCNSFILCRHLMVYCKKYKRIHKKFIFLFCYFVKLANYYNLCRKYFRRLKIYIIHLRQKIFVSLTSRLFKTFKWVNSQPFLSVISYIHTIYSTFLN